jgi:hypothetical protein
MRVARNLTTVASSKNKIRKEKTRQRAQSTSSSVMRKARNLTTVASSVLKEN